MAWTPGGVGFEMVVDHDAALDLETGRARQAALARMPTATTTASAAMMRAVAQLHPLDRPSPAMRAVSRLQTHGDAPGLDRALEHERGAGIELALHQPVHEMEER